MKKAIISGVAALACLHAYAEFYTGNRLLALMQGDTADKVQAIGYVAGAADAITGVYWCPPAGVTLGQAFDLTQRLLEAAPAERHQTADTFVRAALSRAFPCQRQQKQPGREV